MCLSQELGGPNETILSDVPYGKLTARTFRTNNDVIKDTFVPLLVRFLQVRFHCLRTSRRGSSSVLTLIQGVYEENETADTIRDATTDICNLYLYFQTYDWTMSWNHPTTTVATGTA